MALEPPEAPVSVLLRSVNLVLKQKLRQPLYNRFTRPSAGSR